MNTTSTNKAAPVKNTTLGKSVAPAGQKGTGDTGVFVKRLTKAANKLVSPFKAYVKWPDVPIATAMKVGELICTDKSLKR